MFRPSQLVRPGLLSCALLAGLAAQDIEALMKGNPPEAARPKGAEKADPAKGKPPAAPGKPFTWNGVALPIHRTSAGAYAVVEAGLASTESLLKDLRRMMDEAVRLKDEWTRARQDLDALVAGKDAFMAEIRSGLFCSGCGRTKSDILSKGEQFPHSGQHIVPPSAAQIAQFERDYDARIATARAKVQAKDDGMRKKQQDIEETTRRMSHHLALAVDGLRQEAPLMLDGFKADKCPLEENLALWKRRLETSRDPQERDRLRANAEGTRQRIETLGADFMRQRVKLWNQLSRCQRDHDDASTLVGPAAIPPRWFGNLVAQMPAAQDVTCR